ncbi:uncharacterized protein LOC107265792 [Cephus cinctus]|uniref:Uncharacterized protein LOC107265792 n=1 Tax=Cephus cinctus TaxID=211228 RepID=A0AAJ7BPB8_CEPCN|nr:uncharacterized protein LOC107265792 [Cephus cinctus]XP_015591089.1 uncharacterized protein LOC107265792 [Cephus cinctus]
MPGYRQPNSLEVLSLGRVCQQLDGTCRRLQVLSQESSAPQVLAFAKQTIRPYYVNALPARLRSQIIEETSRMLYGPSSDGSTLISGPAPLYLLALLLGHDIKQLKVNLCCYYGCSHQTSLLKLLATEGVGLEYLELARSALLRLDCKLLRSALMSTKNLLSLTLRNIASDAVLQVVGKACPKLVILDVACSRQVTDAGLKQLLLQVELRDKVPPLTTQEPTSWLRLKTLLSKLKVKSSKTEKNEKQGVLLEYYESRNFLCDTLRVLNVANTGVTSAGVLLALVHVPSLESLAEYSHMGRVVEIMNRGVISFKTPFSLIQARSCRTTPARLELLAQACPRVEKLHISEPHHPPEALRLFPYVTSLSVHGIPAQKEWLDGFYEYLRTNGQKLHDLNLRMMQSENPLDLDLKEIFYSCPNLRTLTKDGANVIWTDGPDPSSLKYLKKVQLGRTVSALTITKILFLAPELTALHVHSCYDLTNGHLEKLLNVSTMRSKSSRKSDKYENSLIQNLTCFYIYEASKVSATTVLNMFKSCKKLRRIGNLANWGLDCEGVRMLRTTLARANLDVDLCPGSHWFWSNCIQ